MIRALTITLTALSIVGLSAFPVLADDGLSPDSTADSAVKTEQSAPLNLDRIESAENADKKLIADADGDAKPDADAKDAKDGKDDKKGKKEPKPKKEKKEKKAADPTAPKPAKSAKGGSNVNIATRLASFTAGVVFGTPIAVVRRTGMEIAQGEHDLVGDPDTWYRKIGYVMPGFISIPYGSISGGIGGALYSVKNAWTGSGVEPFGKEAFSLGDIGN